MRIAYYCDGTWNDPATDTNIYRMSNATLIQPGQQDARYDNGVGVDGLPLDKLFGGAFGGGLVQKVKDGYTRIAHMYTAGDDLFIFGFSRGSYTARCIAGMISICGLPTKNVDDKCLDIAWQAYRDPDNRKILLASLADYAIQPAKILMLGVFDTVGSLGIPAAWGGIDTHQYGFLNTDLHENVQNAYHAVAIDEQRAQFPPTLWTNACGGVEQVMEQTWFSGVHCDIGGGYAPAPEDNGTRLADLSLAWMVERAQLLGLQFDPKFLAKYNTLNAHYALTQIHNSRVGIFALPIPGPRPRTIPTGAILANSVTIRCQQMPTYIPTNITLTAGVPDPAYNTARTVQNPTTPN
jgi:uncharacterized protein (DUF2235 family)